MAVQAADTHFLCADSSADYEDRRPASRECLESNPLHARRNRCLSVSCESKLANNG
jgi:hypothetical protein